MTTPYSYQRYLAAQKSVDDQALNYTVSAELARRVVWRQAGSPLQVLEVDWGIGTMLERLVEKGILYNGTYTGIDATIFQPPLAPDLDEQIETLYHGVMEARRVGGQPSGGSRTGRRLCGHLKAAGARCGPRDPPTGWFSPAPTAIPRMRLISSTSSLTQALATRPDLDQARFRDWVEAGHLQVERRELFYIVHQLDFLGYI